MTAKRISTILLALLLVFSLAACAGGDAAGDAPATDGATETDSAPAETSGDEAESAGDDAAAVNNNTEGPLGAYAEPVTLTVGMDIDPNQAYPAGQSATDNQYLQHIKNELNIEVDVIWTAATGDDYNQKVNLDIASGSLPDAIRVNDTQYRTMLASDMLEPITDAYNTYASDVLRAMIDSSNGLAMTNMSRDGQQYSLATVSGGDMHTMWIRKDWMDELGLEAPKTIDDITNIAKAFIDNNMGGENTIGIVGPQSGQPLYANYLASGTTNFGLTPLFNAFKSYPGWWVDSPEGAVYGTTTAETKEALTYLADLYAQGILDPEMSIRDDSAEVVVSGQGGILAGSFWLGYAFIPDLLDNDPTANFIAYHAPLNTDGVYACEASSASTSYTVVRKGYEHPEAIVKMANLLLRDEASLDTNTLPVGNYPLRIAFGMRNEKEMMIASLRKVLNGEAQPNDFPEDQLAIYKTLKQDAAAIKQIKLAPYDNMDIQYWNREADPASFNRIWSWMVGFGPFVDSPYTPVYSLSYSQTPTAETKWAQIKKLEDEAILKIIMGVEPVEYFDTFVADWYAEGGEEITQEVRDSL